MDSHWQKKPFVAPQAKSPSEAVGIYTERNICKKNI